MKQSFVNGSTLLGTAISLYAFSELLQVSGWKYWGLIFGVFFMLGASIVEFSSFNKK